MIGRTGVTDFRSTGGSGGCGSGSSQRAWIGDKVSASTTSIRSRSSRVGGHANVVA
jgi:hypothetical protein